MTKESLSKHPVSCCQDPGAVSKVVLKWPCLLPQDTGVLVGWLRVEGDRFVVGFLVVFACLFVGWLVLTCFLVAWLVGWLTPWLLHQHHGVSQYGLVPHTPFETKMHMIR